MNPKDIQATAIAQGLMSNFYGDRPIGPPGRPASVMRVDGKWGTYTQSAYQGLDDDTRAVLDKALASLGTSANQLSRTRAVNRVAAAPEQQVVESGLKRYFDLEAVQAAVRRAVYDLRVSERLTKGGVKNVDRVIAVITGRDILDLEAARGRDGSYDAFSQAGSTSASGLWQFTSATWNTTIAQLRRSGVKQDFVPFTVQEGKARILRPGGPFDLTSAAYAYVWLTLQNALTLARNSLPVTTGTLYTLHQQGESNGVRYLKGLSRLDNEAQQSRQSIAVMAAAKAEASASA